MTRVMWALIVVLAAWTMSAQAQVTAVDLSGLGMGVLMMPQSVETDGHPDTREWLVRPLLSTQGRIIAERSGRLCVGPWFDLSQWTIQRIGFTDWLTRMNGQVFERQPLMTPACP